MADAPQRNSRVRRPRPSTANAAWAACCRAIATEIRTAAGEWTPNRVPRPPAARNLAFAATSPSGRLALSAHKRIAATPPPARTRGSATTRRLRVSASPSRRLIPISKPRTARSRTRTAGTSAKPLFGAATRGQAAPCPIAGPQLAPIHPRHPQTPSPCTTPTSPSTFIRPPTSCAAWPCACQTPAPTPTRTAPAARTRPPAPAPPAADRPCRRTRP